MAILKRKALLELEEYYYWLGYKNCIPFPVELTEELLEIYGKGPHPYTWTEQDIHEGTRKIINKYLNI